MISEMNENNYNWFRNFDVIVSLSPIHGGWWISFDRMNEMCQTFKRIYLPQVSAKKHMTNP